MSLTKKQRAAITDGIGPSGDFPLGRYSDEDQGGLNAEVRYDQNKDRIVVDFGASITWLAMSREEALLFAQVLIQKCKDT